MTYTLGSLFAGIGGIDLAFAWAGFEIAWQVEIDDYCTKVLEKHWPQTPKARDVRTCTGIEGTAGTVLPYADVLAGGFPCQPHSVAGRRLGEADSRNLWPEFRRLIGELRPRAVLLENVPGITTTMGAGILADLASLGYVGRAGFIRASDAGAPHQRERWFCVAHAAEPRLAVGQGVARHDGAQQQAAQRGRGTRPGRQTEPGLGRNFARLPYRLDFPGWPAPPGQAQHAWEPPRVVAGTVPDRVARLKALGNAVVPQVIYPLAVAIRDCLAAQDADAAERAA